MREKIKDKGRLLHILMAINVLLEHKDKYNFDEIKDDPIIFFGFVKQMEIIGEAVYMLTKEYKELHSEVDWLQIEKMRHVLVHGYYTITPEVVWATIEDDLPVLKPQIERLIAIEGTE